MAIQRYWRMVGIATSGNGTLEISEARVYENGTLADASATRSCTFAPTSGALADLADGSATGVVSWPYASYGSASFALMWDFGSGGGVDVFGLRLGSGSAAATFPLDAIYQYSADAITWTTYASSVAITYPGANALTAVPSGATPIAVDASPAKRLRLIAPTPQRMLPDPAYDLPALNMHGHPREYVQFDLYNGGVGRVRGTVKDKALPINIPVFCRVDLIDEQSRVVIREQWTNPVTGAYDFKGIKMGVPYTTLAYDPTGAERAVVANGQIPESMV